MSILQRTSFFVAASLVAAAVVSLAGCCCTECGSELRTDQLQVTGAGVEATGGDLAGISAPEVKPSKVFVAGRPVSSGPKSATATATVNTASVAIDVLQRFMTGTFSSEAQHQSDPENFFDIHLHMTPIWENRSSLTERWLYVEQASAQALDKPYRQRVYRLAAVGGNQVRSEVFEFADGKPLVHAGKWQAPQAFDALERKDIVAREGCALLLTYDGSIFKGATDGQSCLTDFRGAKYTTSEAIISPAGLLTWDRGWNAKGEQVWGATKGGYNFLRVTE